VLFVCVMGEISCAHDIVSIEEDRSVHPMLAVPYKPFGPLDTKDAKKRNVAKKKRRETVSKAFHGKRTNTQETIKAQSDIGEATEPLVLKSGADGSKGREETLRAELVASARRLLGIRKSFDERSFIGHILKVCGLTEANKDSKDILAEDLFETKKGRRVMQDEVLPGDLVFFKCPSNCGAQTRKGVGVGVVVRVLGHCVEFVTYTDHEVTLAFAGSQCQKRPRQSVVIKEILGFISLLEPKSNPKPSL